MCKHLYAFQPGEGPSRGLLCDFEIFVNLWIAFVSSSNLAPGATVVMVGGCGCFNNSMPIVRVSFGDRNRQFPVTLI